MAVETKLVYRIKMKRFERKAFEIDPYEQGKENS